MARRRLYLVRHGAAEGAAGRAVGHTDLPLSASGRRAVERLAASWQGPPPDRLLTSPLARAAESAALLAAAWGAPPPRPEPRLAEMSFGAWDGRRWDDLHATDGDRLAAWADRWWQAATPEGEGFADLARRVGEWWDAWSDEAAGDQAAPAQADESAADRAAAEAAGEATPGQAAALEAASDDARRPDRPPRVTVAVTHGGPVRALLAGRLGVPREELWDLPVGLARVTAIEVAAGRPPRLLFVGRAGFAAPPGAGAR